MAFQQSVWVPRSKTPKVVRAKTGGNAVLPDATLPMLFGCSGVYVELAPTELDEFRAGMRFAGAVVIISALSIFLLFSCFGGL